MLNHSTINHSTPTVHTNEHVLSSTTLAKLVYGLVVYHFPKLNELDRKSGMP